MKSFALLCLAALAMMQRTPDANAQRPGPGAHGKPTLEMKFKKLDRDGDGTISRDEFRGPPAGFKGLDGNGDGRLTLEELKAGMAARSSGGAAGGRGGPGGDPQALLAWYEKLPVILTHTHPVGKTGKGEQKVNDEQGTISRALELMDENHVRAAVLMTPPLTGGRFEVQWFDSMMGTAREHPGRFRVSGGGESLNPLVQATPPDKVDAKVREQFTRWAEDIVRKGGVGFGEMAALHFSFKITHGFAESPPDHPLFLLLADLAAKHNKPIDLHMEAASRRLKRSKHLRELSSANPEWVAENISAFERLLAHNRKARIIWVHLGMDSTGHRTPELTRRLLRENGNLYISMTGAWHILNRNSDHSHHFMEKGRGLHPEWRKVILEFPDRFMIGSDQFFVPAGATQRMPQNLKPAVLIVRRPFLPPPVARKVAFENAQHLFGLNLIRTEEVPLPPGFDRQPANRRMAATHRPRKKPFMSQDEIRRKIIGNTLTFVAPSNGKTLFVHFAEGGEIQFKVAGNSRVIRKKWFFDDRGLLCRTYGRQNRNHCTRVRAKDDPESVLLFNSKLKYDARILRGRQLSR